MVVAVHVKTNAKYVQKNIRNFQNIVKVMKNGKASIQKAEQVMLLI